MANWRIAKIPDGKASPDGMSISLRVVTDDGQEHQMEIPYDQLNFAVQALLQLSLGAYQQQIKSGALPFESSHIGSSITMEAFRTLRDQSGSHLLVQIHGRQSPTQPLGMGSFRLDEQFARKLGNSLLESAELLRQSKKPS